jgi:Protein of unknown function (DUF1552)
MGPMISTKKHMSRRAVLRGLGATIALPLLDGMVPAFAAMRQTAAKPVRRFAAFYLPNGMSMASWTPSGEGTAFEFSPILEPLAPFRDRLVVVSGMCNKEADPRPGEGDGDHSRAQAGFLTGAHAKKTGSGADIEAGISMDQIAAREFGKETQLASLELALESYDLVGQCEDGYGCAYSATIAWRNAKTPLPMEADPRAVFERLFGVSDSTDRGARLAQIRRDRSILDMVSGQLADLERVLGQGDRTRLTEYLDSIRDVERRIQLAEQQSDRELPTIHQPAGIPDSFEAYAKLMYDLLALAYQCDLTRVATFLYGREKSVRTYPEIGVPDPHHPVSHHQKRADHLEKLARINNYHVKMFGYFLEKLRATPDGDGSLLDHSLLVYGAGMSDSDTHFHHNLPIVLAGGGAGQISGGRHLRFENEPPLANLHVTLLDKLGIRAERLGDSDGRVPELSGV